MNDRYLIFKYGEAAFLLENRPEHYDELADCDKYVLQEWIRECLDPYVTKNYNYSVPTSYALKHAFQYSNTGFYITNGQFKGAMLAAGHHPKDPLTLNWVFKLGKRAGYKRDLEVPFV